MPLDPTNKLVLQGSAGALIVRALAAATVLVMNILIARVLSVSDYGAIALGLSWLTIASTLACFGTETVSVRFVAQANSVGDSNAISSIVRWGRRLTIAFGTVVATASCVLIFLVFSEYANHQLLGMCMIVAVTPALAYTLTSASVLRGLKQVVRAVSLEMLLRPVLIILLVTVFLLTYVLSPSVILIAACIVLAHGVLATVSYFSTRSLIVGDTNAKSPPNREWWLATRPIAFMNVMSVLIANVDLVLVGFFVNAESAGIYRASAQLAILVSFGLSASNGIVAPLIAELYAAKRLEELKKTLRFSVGLVAALGVAGAMLLGSAGQLALSLFGSEYRLGYAALIVLLVGQVVNALCGPTGFAMSMTGHQVQAARIFFASAVLSLMLNLLLIPMIGIIGAAIANVTGIVTWNIAILYYLRNKLGIDTSILTWIPTKLAQR